MKHWARQVLESAVERNQWIDHDKRGEIERIIGLVEQCDVHSFRTEEFEAIADEFEECDELAELSNLLLRTSTLAGFENYALFVIHQGASGGFRTRLCTSYSGEWLLHYFQNSYQYVDPVAIQSSIQDGSFLYSELEFDAPIVEGFWNDAERFGVGRNGICFVMTRQDGSRIGVAFSTTETAEKVANLALLNGFDLEFLACQAVDCFCFLASGLPVSENKLSIEELRYLYVLSSNPDPEETLGTIFNLGSSELIQVSICQKLQTGSIFQAIALATAKGWFNSLPLGPGDV